MSPPPWRRRPTPSPDPDPATVEVGRDNSGILSTGPGATNLQQQIANATVVPAEALIAPEGIAAPAGLVNLPVAPALFVGRHGALEQLDAVSRDSVVLVQAVHGLGGIGKSTLVAHWAALHREDYAPIWWITADTQAGLDAGLVALAGALQPGVVEVLPSEALRERAIRWLAAHPGWLLILDNVTDPRHLEGLLARLPADRTGRVLVTSRRATGWSGNIRPLRLDVLDRPAAATLLTGLAARGGIEVDPADADEVCDRLGFLPLAVEQAGAYMAETGTDARAYLRLLAAHPASMFRDADEGREAERTIARIWQVTLDALAREGDALPGRLLRVLAWYAPEAIPRTLVDALDDDEPAIRRTIGRLAAYNMITVDPGQDTITVHRLVQAVARTPDPGDPHRRTDDIGTARAAARDALLARIPEDWRQPAEWPRWRSLLPHLDSVTSLTATDRIEADDVWTYGFLLNHAGLFLLNQGDVSAALDYFSQVVTDCRRVLGDDHPDTLAAINNLAIAYRSAGDLDRAIPLYEQTLTDRRRILGDDHPDTLTSANNLAAAYRSAGDLDRAIPLYEQTLTDRRRVQGDDHPDTLTSANNLASAYESAGDLDRAIPLHVKTLADRRRMLGDDHPDTLNSANNLAYAYESAGDLDRAIPLYEHNLADRRRVLGDDHPDTLTSANNLASAYESAGDLDRAMPLQVQSLSDRRRVLGDDHPDTLSSASNLASAYWAAGELNRAILLYQQTLDDCRRALGDNHPVTRAIERNTELAVARLAAETG